MKNFLKVVTLLAIIGIAIIASLFVLDVTPIEEIKDTLQKFLLVLAILALSGLAIDFIFGRKKNS